VTSSEGAVVIGADYRGLGVVRSLGRRGLPVVVLRAPDDRGPAAMSRYATRTLPWPEDHAARDALLLDLAERGGAAGWVLVPTGDEGAAYVAHRHEQLSRHFLLSTPCWGVFRWAYDKRLTYDLADRAGVPHPCTLPLDHRADAEAYAGRFPALLKPAAKPRPDRLAHDKAWVVNDTDELLACYDEAVSLGDGDILMVQEIVEGRRGGQMSFAALWRDGEPVVSVCARRTRQHPVDIGRSSTFVETVDDPEVEDLSRRLASALRLDGLAEIEFKRDDQGRCQLLDLNARIWGWHTICRSQGLDFPYLVWLQCHGEEVPRLQARPGARWLRLVTDVPAAGRQLARGDTDLRSYVRSMVGPHERALYAPDDPVPALLELPAYLWTLRGRRRRRAAVRGDAACTHRGAAGSSPTPEAPTAVAGGG
jgi:predicted ATP-grasp superfamily ATP-dependent carboligase